MLKKYNRYAILILTFINILFPSLGLIFFILILLNGYRKSAVINIIYSLACLAVNYVDIGRTGDITRYIINFEKGIKLNILSSNYSWNFINFIFYKFKFNFHIISFLAILLICYCNFKIIELNVENNRIKKNIFIKFLLLNSFPILFSTYRNNVAISLVIYGTYLLENKKKRGAIWIIFGIGFHISSIVILLIYLLSKVIKLERKSLILGLVLSQIIFKLSITKKILEYLSTYSIVFRKAVYYIYGEWGKYEIKSQGDYLTYYMLGILVLLLFSIDRKSFNKLSKEYKNYLYLYLFFICIFSFSKTITIRYLILGYGMLVPLLSVFLNEKKKIITRMLWYLYIDPRWFALFYLKYFRIGNGFPYNLIDTVYFMIDVLI